MVASPHTNNTPRSVVNKTIFHGWIISLITRYKNITFWQTHITSSIDEKKKKRQDILTKLSGEASRVMKLISQPVVNKQGARPWQVL